jgi:FMN phosphatase YigB (HAD superfamily)
MTKTLPKILILDLDGTLYNQKLLRAINVISLAINLLQKKVGKSDLLLLSEFRQLQEITSSAEKSIQSTFDSIAHRFELPVSEVKTIRDRWMVDNQKFALVISKRRWLARRIFHLRKEGILVAVWSDNPVEKKMEYLGCKVDFILTSEDLEINLGKPNPKGLLKILRYFEVNPSEAIFIGDRIDRDGQSAQRAGVKFQMIGFRSRILLFKMNRELTVR